MGHIIAHMVGFVKHAVYLTAQRRYDRIGSCVRSIFGPSVLQLCSTQFEPFGPGTPGPDYRAMSAGSGPATLGLDRTVIPEPVQTGVT
jgi:hypothetical protein